MNNTLDNLQKTLTTEIISRLDNISNSNKSDGYKNKDLGKISFLLGALLNELLAGQSAEWNSPKWIDDSLLSDAKLEQDLISIRGVMIWGIDNTTEQWTEPFYFEIALDENRSDFVSYNFLFGDAHKPEISYSIFRHNRTCWEPAVKKWKYAFHIKNDLPR